MSSFHITTNDFQEVLSSLFLAELSYDARMKFSHGASLVPDFVPTLENIPHIESVTDKIRTIFNVPLDIQPGKHALRQLAERLCEEWKSTERHITFFTSGSTGEPKPNTHDIALHVQEVTALAEIFSDRKRIVSFVPRHHIYGFLFSILLPKALKVDVRWEVPLPAPGLVSSLRSGDLVIAFPLLWDKLSDMKVRFGKDIQGITSTGPCPAETITTLCKNGLDRMYEIYGSSETGGVGYRHTPDGGYSLLPYWSVTQNDSTLLRDHPTLGSQQYPLQDILQWKGDTFTPMRRADNGVQVAGINVYPSRIREILLEHPEVKDCAVRLMRSEEGSRLKTLIVLENMNRMQEMEPQIRKWAKERLSPYELPGGWSFARKLPTNELGKLKDW